MSLCRKEIQRRTFSKEKWPDKKTIDIGRNGVTVSADPMGRIYQLTAPTCNKQYGLMVAAPWSQFDNAERTNPDYVRQFRKIMENMLEEHRCGLGIGFDIMNGPVIIRHIRDSLGSEVQFEYCVKEQNLFFQTVLKANENGTILQASKVTNTGSSNQNLCVFLDLGCAVSRAGYGQLTDRGEVPMPDPTNIAYSTNGKNESRMVAIDNKSLGGRLVAYVTFYNATSRRSMKIEQTLLPPNGPIQEEQPPSHDQARRQLVPISSGEILKFAVLFRPDTLQPSDKSSPFAYFLDPKTIDVDELVNDSLFAHDDGLSYSEIILKRHFREIAGFNRDKHETVEATVLWANINYIIGCCSIPVWHPEHKSYCVIADHFALPLGWPRDNYWQLRLLRKLSMGGRSTNIDRLFPVTSDKARDYTYTITQILTGHLWWLFKVATTEVPVGNDIRHYWRRSYLINGQPKDGTVFQLDTQCYPFLELCEYWEAYGHDPLAKEVVGSILRTESLKKVLTDLLGRRDPITGLFASDETPADDELGDYKFHLSSNILLWHTLVKLSELLGHSNFMPIAEGSLDMPCRPWIVLKGLAFSIKKRILRYFITQSTLYDGRPMLAYGYDPSKNSDDPERHRRYHDGNDLPTLYANEWGFFENHDGELEDEVELGDLWKNTMTWAFTPDPNPSRTPGFNTGYQGTGTEPFHGLGSDHSPGPWTLGFFQEWKYAQMVGDKERERKAWAKIAGSVQWDGTFSEAVDIQDGKCTSKTWFSWPGAMIAENLVDTVIEQVETSRGK
ncbi:hypothetical protein VP1G_06973 [Cytospora mali]|uniref:Uncharacterized protein n=1 Tax=Cytospora mali TaxID=578113 RepID=A0A194V794_CYTMA|nr:hypothetical protein VP1G_06973 [Valsa mali var. pyri (nom. inval.)]